MSNATRFFQFRLSLRAREQKELFFDDSVSRQEWIETLFGQSVEFKNRNSRFTYIQTLRDERRGLIVGRLGRSMPVKENMPPERGLREYYRDSWRACIILIDPYEHEDGQKVAFQYLPDVGQPHVLLPRIVEAASQAHDFIPFFTSVHPISEERAFDDFLISNKGRITRVTFELEVPNMFGVEDEYDREMEEYKRRERAKKVKIEVSNPDGINEESERIRFTAEKAMQRGTGSVRAKALGRRNTFDSRKHRRSVEVEGLKEVLDESLEQEVLERSSAILDREDKS